MAIPGVLKGTEVPQKQWNILLYGAPGVGKTTFCADAPKPLFLELDPNGAIVLRNREDVSVLLVDDVARLHNFLARAQKFPRELNDYETIILDTFSSYQQLERLRQVTAKGDPLDDAWLFNEGIYARNNTRAAHLLRTLISLGKNLVVVCHQEEQRVGPDNNATIVIRPAVSGKLLSSSLAQLDACFLLKVEGPNRILQLSGGASVQLKTRFSLPGTKIINPSFKQLLTILEGPRNNE